MSLLGNQVYGVGLCLLFIIANRMIKLMSVTFSGQAAEYCVKGQSLN